MQIDEFKESASVPGRLEQQCNRMLAVKMVENDVPVHKVAKACGVTVRSVYDGLIRSKEWAKRGDWRAKVRGRPQKVSPTQKNLLALTVRDDTPANWGLESNYERSIT